MEIHKTFLGGLDPSRLQRAVAEGRVSQPQLEAVAFAGGGSVYLEALQRVASEAGAPPGGALVDYGTSASLLARKLLEDTFSLAAPEQPPVLSHADFVAAVNADAIGPAELRVLAQGDWTEEFLRVLLKVGGLAGAPLGMSALKFDREAVGFARRQLESSGPLAPPLASKLQLSGERPPGAPPPSGKLGWEVE